MENFGFFYSSHGGGGWGVSEARVTFVTLFFVFFWRLPLNLFETFLRWFADEFAMWILSRFKRIFSMQNKWNKNYFLNEFSTHCATFQFNNNNFPDRNNPFPFSTSSFRFVSPDPLTPNRTKSSFTFLCLIMLLAIIYICKIKYLFWVCFGLIKTHLTSCCGGTVRHSCVLCL